MKRERLILKSAVLALLFSGILQAQNAPKRAAETGAQTQSNTQKQGGDLQSVLKAMNASAANFKAAQADFTWDQYDAVVKETYTQKGTIYFRRTKTGLDAAVRVTAPDPKQVVFKDGKLRLYQPKIDQITEYSAGSNRGQVESIMSLGFGARGEDLAKAYDLRLLGWETIDNVATAHLELIPRDQKFKASINRVELWIDPERNISLKQQFFEPGGNYRLTHYTNINLSGKVPDKAFEIKTTSKTRVVTQQ
ncbi:MAG TPA: outer membrane lipoprotein carrier protein LolA [Candidatus Angelobacter sp.]|jgi:outer membrane lipoprotein-sorting protein|nr:outer membrane lipoprotein carrier protein LolA [Candidatus Angelobacter sp.]